MEVLLLLLEDILEKILLCQACFLGTTALATPPAKLAVDSWNHSIEVTKRVWSLKEVTNSGWSKSEALMTRKRRG
jgi:hypothetical protein